MDIPIEIVQKTEDIRMCDTCYCTVPFWDGKRYDMKIDPDMIIAQFDCKDGTCYVLIRTKRKPVFPLSP